MLGSNVCEALPGLHVFTGCDTVSAFFGKGKMAASKIVRNDQDCQKLFQDVGMEWGLSDERSNKLQEFTCKLYASRTGNKHVNELRYRWVLFHYHYHQ